MSVDDKGKTRKAKGKKAKEGKNKDSQRITLLPDFCLPDFSFRPSRRPPAASSSLPVSSVSQVNN
jgi:hypothetical protein